MAGFNLDQFGARFFCKALNPAGRDGPTKTSQPWRAAVFEQRRSIQLLFSEFTVFVFGCVWSDSQWGICAHIFHQAAL